MEKTTRHGRREFLQGGAALFAAAPWTARHGAMQRQDRPAVHGMLLVGEETPFLLSHLPISGAPHDFQVILEVRFAKTGSNPQADYFADRKRTGTKVYTIEPTRFVLPQLAAAEPLRSFKASLYRGHFERFPSQAAKGAARIAQDVEVTVTNVVTFQRFAPGATKAAQLEYQVFGKGRERFLAHVITGSARFRPGRAGRARSTVNRSGDWQGCPNPDPGQVECGQRSDPRYRPGLRPAGRVRSGHANAAIESGH